MAAYAALVSLFNDLELIPNHPIHSFSFYNKQLSSLSHTVQLLIDFVETYDSHGCDGDAADVLESRIATAAHAAHDVIESHIVDQIRAGSTRSGKARPYFLLDLQRAIDDMEFVKRKAMQFKANGRVKADQPTYSSPSSSAAVATSSEAVKKNGMVGFDGVIVQLMDILTGEPSNQRLVVPIAGMGGLGKTSLAQTVYVHSCVNDHFDVRLWATISQQYNAQNILAQLLGKSTTGKDVSELGEELYKSLYGRRYFVVLDDMWSEEAWDKVHIFFSENGNGSRVVVTTRLSDLAARLSSFTFKMDFLDQDKSWELFCGKAFGEQGCPVVLEEIGKKIVRRCRGLPLSIVVMGGHLRRSPREIGYWEKVAGYMNPISSIGEEEQCLEILSLSYQHLPAYLKSCFLYLGIFKEDGVIEASKLLYWIGEGFIKPKEGLSLEEVGEDYLKDLIERNLILVEGWNWNGKVESCKVHDSVREMCLRVCKKEKFMFAVEDTIQATSCREHRLVIPEGKRLDSDMIGAMLSAPHLRTLVHQGDSIFFNELFADCRLLRVLVCDNIAAPDAYLPLAHFFQPLNMRALVFERFRQRVAESAYSFVSSISSCWNLQTLFLMTSYGDCPITLPYETWEMPRLRHLRATAVFLTDPATQEERIVLQNLHTLEGVVNLRLTEEVCKRMPNLKVLSVVYNEFCDHDCCLHNLGRLNKLKSLTIFSKSDAVLSLTFPTSLEKLCLFTKNCHLWWEDLTIMISSLSHLGSLQVDSVRGSEWNLDEEVFCCLKRLEIYDCDDLIDWNANSSHFPVLESLCLFGMPKLSEIPLDIGDIPTLRLIQLGHCGASAVVSAVRMVMEQETYGNYDIQLRVEFWEYKREEFERFREMLKEEEECLTSNSIHIYYNGKKIKKTFF